jgi:hypothetical protein
LKPLHGICNWPHSCSLAHVCLASFEPFCWREMHICGREPRPRKSPSQRRQAGM